MESEGGLRTSIQLYFSSLFRLANKFSAKQKWALGLVNLASVVIFWVASSFLVNILASGDLYRKPFLITYINTGCFSFYFLGYLRNENISLNQFIKSVKEDYKRVELRTTNDQEARVEYGSNDDLAGFNDGFRIIGSRDEQIGPFETIKLSMQFTTLWFLANLVTNASLAYTSVASQTILSSTSSFFTLLIGYLYSVEKINKNKIFGILLSFAGVLLVTDMDWSTPSDGSSDPNFMALVGNTLALLGAIIYGTYTILLKLKTKGKYSVKERTLNTHLFFGFVGIYSLIFLWPFLIVLHVTKYETFELPPNSKVSIIIISNAVLTFISDFCWCNAVLLTSPLTVTVGLSLTIPLAMIGDWVLQGFAINLLYLFGAIIVTIGFLIINRDERSDFTTEAI
ncbi:uncharacterized protein PRCAT00005002001 [Priceomyces carsonii]|uniref:uncharacterized protein n=1 Tax=Priceomyces carsonii TaxID=28549 RepID=UPI002ED78E01|nr:unnamed protein product [Priceomyces carsonii]